jgi:hypothetical protein
LIYPLNHFPRANIQPNTGINPSHCRAADGQKPATIGSKV